VTPVATGTDGLAFAELGPDDPRWEAFAGGTGASPFQHPAWLRALREAYGCRGAALAVVDGAGRVAAGLPVLRVARAGRATWVSLPFTDHCPPLAAGAGAVDALAAAVAAWQAARGVRLEVRGALPAGPGWRAAQVGVRHMLPLDGGADAVGRRVPPPAMRHVRSALRNGLRARVTRSPLDLPAFYRLHARTRRRLGVPVQPRRFVAALWRHVIESGLGFAVLAEVPGGEAVGAGLYVASGASAVMKFSASEPSCWHLKPNHLVTWTAIEEACGRGCATLDFGRSELRHASLRRYKASWGAEEVPLVYTCRGGAGAAGPGRLGDAMGAVIRRSPVVVCRALGELLYPLAG